MPTSASRARTLAGSAGGGGSDHPIRPPTAVPTTLSIPRADIPGLLRGKRLAGIASFLAGAVPHIGPRSRVPVTVLRLSADPGGPRGGGPKGGGLRGGGPRTAGRERRERGRVIHRIQPTHRRLTAGEQLPG